MRKAVPRREIVRRLLETACRSAQWDTELGASPSQRLAAALAAHRFELRAAGVTLLAEMTEDICLAVRVRVDGDWNPDVASEVRAALDASTSLVAGLLVSEWQDIAEACRAAARPRAA